MNKCERSEALRDYAFEEISGAERVAMERHVETCALCEAELRSIQLTTAMLRSIPDREIPQRIAFVSDKIFEPSPWARFWRGFFGSPMQVGFASACLLAAAISFSAMRKPVEIRTVVATNGGASVDVSKVVDTAVQKVVAQVRAEDAKATDAALAVAEVRHQEEHKMLLASMQETMEVMQKRMGAYTSLASLETPQTGGGQ